MPKAADPSKSVANRVAQFEKSGQQLRDHRRNAALRESRTDEKGKENDQQPQTPKSNQKTNAEEKTPDAIPSQNASSSPNGKSKRHKTKWIQKTTPQPNRETKEAVNDDIVINTQLHYNETPTVDYAKRSEMRNKSFTFIPMEDLETHQTTNVFVNDPNGNSPFQLHQDLQDEKVPEVYQFLSQDNRVYSDYITMLPTEDIIAQFHKQPHEIHFGGTDYQHYFNEKYEYSAPYPTEDHARAIKNAKLVTPQNITTLNIMANLYESQTRTFIFTPTTNYDFNKDASHNTSAHVSMLLNALASLARAKIHVRGTLILLVSDPRVCEATTGIRDYSQAYAKARRFMVDQKKSQNFVPLNMVLKNHQKLFDTCSAPHPEGYIMITLDNLSEFQYTPPKFSPLSPGHDLAQAEAFISPQQEARHTPPITDYVRIDISRDLEVLAEEDAFQFFNKLIKPDLQDASSITSTNCAHYRGEIKKRGSPIGSTHARFDIETNSALSSQIAKTVQSHYPLDRNPLIIAFPYNLSAHENTFMISASKSSAKNGVKLEPTELLNRVASLEKMNSILQFAILRTKYSVLVHLDVHSIPSNTETRVSKLKWMNEQCKKAGLTFFNHDNTYAVLSDAPLSYRAKPSYTPTNAKLVVICAPRSISFRDINKATSLFGTFTSIQPLESNPSAKSHQYFEALFQNLGSSILAHQEKVQGITFTSGSPNLLKKQNIIDSIVKDHATSKWEATLLAAKEFGSEKQLRSINERLIVAKPQ